MLPDSPASEAPAASPSWRTLFALWLTVFAASSQVIIVSPLLPDISRALLVPEARLGLVVTAYAAMLGVFALVAGPVSDYAGRRRILLVGTLAMGVTLLLHGLAHTFEALVAVRALAGAAGGLLSGAAVAYVGDAWPYERRGWANGWVMSGIAAGQILGVPIGKALAVRYDVVAPFLAFGVVALVAVGLVAAFVPQPNVARTPSLSVGSALRAYGALLRQAAPRTAAFAYVLMFAGVGAFVPYYPLWLERVVGVTGRQIVTLFLVGGLVNVAVGPVAGRLSDRIGRRPLIVTSCLLFAAVLVAIPHVVTGIATATALFALAMVSVAMRISPLQSLVSSLVPAEQRGVMMSGAVALGQVGMAAGAALSGPLYEHFGILGTTTAGATTLLAMAAVSSRLPEPEPAALPADALPA